MSMLRYALFLDFDGTLVDIAPTPDAVIVSDELRETLCALRERFDGAMALVSGRRIDNIDAFMAPHQFDAGGLHGLEIRIGGKLLERPVSDRASLNAIAARLSKRLVEWPGAMLEDKEHSLAVHWRMAPEAGPVLADLMEEATAALGPDYRLQRGKAVAEILPAHADKGRAIEAILNEAPYKGRIPIFFGDDVTDEDGIRIVNSRGGLSVNVGARSSAATYREPDPHYVRTRLRRWAQELPEDFRADLRGAA
jgi:trehalose 6-phosphate phosphatase